MKTYLQYFAYIVRHKYFVFVAGLKTKTPIWQLVIHDLSKFLPSEFGAYARYFYGPFVDYFKHSNPLHIPEGCFTCDKDALEIKAVKNDFTMAWLSHQRRNKHHWEYWVMSKGPDEQKALPLPDNYVRELVSDWAGTGRAITGNWDVKSWYEKHKDEIMLHPGTRDRIEALIAAYF